MLHPEIILPGMVLTQLTCLKNAWKVMPALTITSQFLILSYFKKVEHFFLFNKCLLKNNNRNIKRQSKHIAYDRQSKKVEQLKRVQCSPIFGDHLKIFKTCCCTKYQIHKYGYIC